MATQTPRQCAAAWGAQARLRHTLPDFQPGSSNTHPTEPRGSASGNRRRRSRQPWTLWWDRQRRMRVSPTSPSPRKHRPHQWPCGFARVGPKAHALGCREPLELTVPATSIEGVDATASIFREPGVDVFLAPDQLCGLRPAQGESRCLH